MLISFIIPMFNCEKYVTECIESILSVNYQSIEIIVINDGSTDKSLEIVTKEYKNNQKVKIVSKKNEGLSKTRNFGINKSRGDYIFFVDSDDLLVPKAVENIISICSSNRYDVIVGNFNYYINGKLLDSPFNLSNRTDDSLNYLLEIKNLTAEAVKFIVRRDFLLENNIVFFPKLLHEDELYMVELLMPVESSRICTINEVFYLYRENDVGITKNKTIKNYLDMLQISEKLYKYSNDVDELNLKRFIIKRANLLFVSSAEALHKLKKKDKILLKKQLIMSYRNFYENKFTKKEKIACFIIKILGLGCFSLVQGIRKKWERF